MYRWKVDLASILLLYNDRGNTSDIFKVYNDSPWSISYQSSNYLMDSEGCLRCESEVGDVLQRNH